MNRESESNELDDSQLGEISGGADELNGKIGLPKGIECRSMYAYTGPINVDLSSTSTSTPTSYGKRPIMCKYGYVPKTQLIAIPIAKPIPTVEDEPKQDKK